MISEIGEGSARPEPKGAAVLPCVQHTGVSADTLLRSASPEAPAPITQSSGLSSSAIKIPVLETASTSSH